MNGVVRHFSLHISVGLNCMYDPSAGLICGQQDIFGDHDTSFCYNVRDPSNHAKQVDGNQPSLSYKNALLRLSFWLAMRTLEIRKNMNAGNGSDAFVTCEILPKTLMALLRQSSMEESIRKRLVELTAERFDDTE